MRSNSIHGTVSYKLSTQQNRITLFVEKGTATHSDTGNSIVGSERSKPEENPAVAGL